MTETTTFPFSGLQGDTPPDADDPRRPLAAILGGGLLAVALVGGAVLAFTGGDEELPLSAGVTSTAAGVPAAPEADAALAQTVPAANTESIARNPFEPKYVEPAPVVVAPSPEPSVAPTAVPVTDLVPVGDLVTVPRAVVVVEPSADLAPVPVASSAPAPAASSAPAPAASAPAPAASSAPSPAPAAREYRLVLTGVSTDLGAPTASFTIDGAVSTVKATEIFGPQQQLLLRSLQQRPEDGQWTATIQVGDARPIDVLVGEAVYVQ